MDITKKQKNAAVFEVILCASLWSIAGVFIKLIPWNSFVIAGARSLLAGAVAFLYMRARKLPFVVSRHSLGSAVSLCLTMVLFVTANKLTTAANAIVLQYTDSAFIVLISALFFGKRFTAADVLAVLATLGGISLFFFDRLSAGSLAGNLVALGSGVTFACYYISLGGATEPERMSGIVMANALTFLIGVPFAFATRPEFSGVPLLCVVILGIFQLGIPYVLLGHASGACPPLACALLCMSEPLLNPLWVYLFDGEAPGTYALAGGAVVIAVVAAWCVHNDRKARRAPAEAA